MSFKTGDIVLLRLRSYEQYPIASTIVSHMAVVWIVDGQAMIVDMNPTPNGPYKEIENVFARGDSVVIYPLSFAVLNYPGSIFLRSLRKELSVEQELKFSESIKNWALGLRYDSAVEKRDWLTWLSLALSTMSPHLSFFLSSYTSLPLSKTSSFCSEMIAEIFRRIGILDKKDSYVFGPIAWIHGISQGAGKRDFLWNEEIRVV